MAKLYTGRARRASLEPPAFSVRLSPGSMNFFGHAALAHRHFQRLAEPPAPPEHALLCLGAMLPDFVGMLRASRPELRHPVLARGVAFHHATDEVFHDLPSFVRLSREAFAWLSAHGLPRGPARAVAHIGVEMLLDESFAEDAEARNAYQAALAVPVGDLLAFAEPLDVERLAALQRALLERAATALRPSPELVAERMRRTLSGRPRLATDDAGQALLGSWVALARPDVAAAAPLIFASLRAQLANFGRAE
jgi:hypothetical protein